MILRILTYILLLSISFSCKKSDPVIELTDLDKKNQASLSQINSAWNISFPSTDPEVSTELNKWKEFQNFIREVKQKPNSSLNAYRIKITNLSNRADSLYLNTPKKFDLPQVRSRLVAMHTQLQALDTYFSLDIIPLDKVSPLFLSLNKELNAFYTQCNEIIIKSKIPTEIGEKEMIKALDTTRSAKTLNFDEMENKEKEDEKKKEIPPPPIDMFNRRK